MANVKIIDIDGEQWNIKDQVAQKRIDELETKMNVKRTSLWEGSGSFLELIEINGLKYFNGYFQKGFEVDTIGQTLFSFRPIEGLTTTNRGLIIGYKIDGGGRYPVVISIEPNGVARAFTIIDNVGQGTHPSVTLYGQFFQLVV